MSGADRITDVWISVSRALWSESSCIQCTVHLSNHEIRFTVPTVDLRPTYGPRKRAGGRAAKPTKLLGPCLVSKLERLILLPHNRSPKSEIRNQSVRQKKTEKRHNTQHYLHHHVVGILQRRRFSSLPIAKKATLAAKYYYYYYEAMYRSSGQP
jgi:hypothetical protein